MLKKNSISYSFVNRNIKCFYFYFRLLYRYTVMSPTAGSAKNATSRQPYVNGTKPFFSVSVLARTFYFLSLAIAMFTLVYVIASNQIYVASSDAMLFRQQLSDIAKPVR